MLLVKALIIVALTVVIFGSAAWFTYDLFIKPEKIAQSEAAEGAGEAPPDPSIPEFEKALAVKKTGKLVEAREALEEFLENNPISTQRDEAKDHLGEVNIQILFSNHPAPEKTEYTVQRNDVLFRVANKNKTGAELIMRANNLERIMLQIGQKLVITPLDISLVINRNEKTVTVLNNRRFLKRYRVAEWKAPEAKNNQPITGKVLQVIAWNDGQRVAFGTKEFAGSTRWVSVSPSGYTLYAAAPADGSPAETEKPAAGLALAPADVEEISVLASKGDPVVVE